MKDYMSEITGCDGKQRMNPESRAFKCLQMFLALCVLSQSIWAKNGTLAESSMIQRAADVSDIWSTGPVLLQMQIKFLAVKAGSIDAQYERVSESWSQWRSSIRSNEFNSTTVASKGSVWELQDVDEKPIRVRQFEHALAALSQSIVGHKVDFARRTQKVGQKYDEVPCVLATEGSRPVQDCFDAHTGTLRAVTEGNWTYLYSDYAPFKGKLFPRLITVYESYTLVAVAQVVGLNAPNVIESGLFAPLEGAVQYTVCKESLGLPLGIGEERISKFVKPDSPQLPPNSGILNNDIVVHGVVGRDGKLHNISVHGSNSLTKAAALDAVKQWQYEPFKVCGSAVEVPVGITINFNKWGRYVGCFGCSRSDSW